MYTEYLKVLSPKTDKAEKKSLGYGIRLLGFLQLSSWVVLRLLPLSEKVESPENWKTETLLQGGIDSMASLE